ncbi:nucleotide-diphospho-sugar transferase [Syncephalastrum racemosum]|uniref:Nucleotide-diphospho-sugar transferase n=1 Tax=Syncephalastrum racemosum TaxID=13706 RepID=A0A1X2HW11_SYNRA|nr:nucleotide-diphospho-sugar transferase [Syncephalastrum racemosum]
MLAAAARRYPYILLQIVLFTYVLCGLGYIVKKHYRGHRLPWQETPSPPEMEVEMITSTDYTFGAHPRNYTTGPRYNPHQMTVQLPEAGNHSPRVKAGFIVLVRNSELFGMLQSMRDLENHFNKKFTYPWIFLNNEPFTEEFKVLTTQATSGKTYYGYVDESMWSYPSWINETFAAERREEMAGVPYGTSESYRHMCRFQSGFFYRHPLVQELGWEYYWRVEPDVRYYCELDYDPFLYMKENKKQYGFTISFKEHAGTIGTLWHTVREFVKQTRLSGKDYFNNLADESLYRFITDEKGDRYNQCHFWTNFEIARLDLWQSEPYSMFFEFLDRSGGFFYERWGDAPVHSIFASLFLRKDEVHYFHDIGYKHSIYQHCPESENLSQRCYCDPAKTLDYTDPMSCLNEYMDAQNAPAPVGKTIGEIFV